VGIGRLAPKHLFEYDSSHSGGRGMHVRVEEGIEEAL
jgi:hypothetical protein